MPINTTSLRKLKVRYMMIMAFLIMYIFATYVAVEYYIFSKNKTNNTFGPPLKLEYVVVHLDFKGAPPRLSYLESILPMLKRHGVNGLLIEYEDMFPYEGKLKKLRALNCYSKEELQKYLAAAVSSGFEIIPLIQTFGHMEFVLKHLKFSNLREVPQAIDSICPSRPMSQSFLEEMLEQQIRFHQRIAPLKYIHVGCDEVNHFNNCSLCQKRNLTTVQALSSHINFVVNTVYALSPHTTVLIWDDMLRNIKPFQCVGLKFRNTEAVYWDYTTSDHEDIHPNMYKYSQIFDSLWVATAFKGADGPTRIIPNLHKRFYNHFQWLNFIYDYGTLKNLYKIKGIILTGWARYKHFHPLCELLPTSIPSLILNLILIEKYENGIVVKDKEHVNEFIANHIENRLRSSLHCQENLDGLPGLFDAQSCKYEESDLYVLLNTLGNRTSVINSVVEHNRYKYMGNLLEIDNNVDPQVLYELKEENEIERELCSVVLHELEVVEDQLIGLLSEYFENFVIKEYVRTKVRRLRKVIMTLLEFWEYKGLSDNSRRAVRNTSTTKLIMKSPPK